MPLGNYDHPSYITRQIVQMGASTAGANGTSGVICFPYMMRVRSASAVVRTAGTSAAAGNAAQIICVGTSVQGFGGTSTTTTTTTATLGSINLGTSTANSVVSTTDMNAQIFPGAVIAVKNGTDATGVAAVALEIHLDPLATWS